MNKRNIEDISDNSPAKDIKSKEIYHKEWLQFRSYLKHNDKPREEEYLQYFSYLHGEKSLSASTLWKTYSMLNSMTKLEYGEKLQMYPSVTQLLKTYNTTYSRRVSSVFTAGELSAFLAMQELDGDPFWILRKAVATLAVSGGLRANDLKDLCFDDIESIGDTYQITIKRSKGCSRFVVPPSQAIYLNNYLVALRAATSDNAMTGRLLKGTPTYHNTKKARFCDQAMGINKIYTLGVDIAKVLKLNNPTKYTGACFGKTSSSSDVITPVRETQWMSQDNSWGNMAHLISNTLNTRNLMEDQSEGYPAIKQEIKDEMNNIEAILPESETVKVKDEIDNSENNNVESDISLPEALKSVCTLIRYFEQNATSSRTEVLNDNRIHLSRLWGVHKHLIDKLTGEGT